MANSRLFQIQRVYMQQFQINENGRKFSEQVESTVGKGDIAPYEQFLLFPQCSKDLYSRHVKTRACKGKGSSPQMDFCELLLSH